MSKPRITFEEAFRRVQVATDNQAELLTFHGSNRQCQVRWINGEVFTTNFYPLERGRIKGPPSTTKERRSESVIQGRRSVNEVQAAKKRQKTCLDKWGVHSVRQLAAVQERIKNTNRTLYGTENAMQNRDVALKSAKNTNRTTSLTHWRTGEEVICKGSYERAYVDYLNMNRIDFAWQVPVTLPSGRVYFLDCKLETGEYVEIKGRKYDDWISKWNEFIGLGLPHLLLERTDLKKLGIKV